MSDDERLTALLKRANELGFNIVYVKDSYAGFATPHELTVTGIKKVYGVYVANGPVPIEEFHNFVTKEQSK